MAWLQERMTGRTAFGAWDKGHFGVRTVGDGVVEIVDGDLVHAILTVRDGVLSVVSDHPLQVTKGYKRVKVPAATLSREPVIVDDGFFRVSGEGYSIRLRFDPYGLPVWAEILEHVAKLFTYVQTYPAIAAAGLLVFALGAAGISLNEAGFAKVQTTVDSISERVRAVEGNQTP